MTTFAINRRWSARPICVVKARSPGDAVASAVRNGVSLLYADLSGINIDGINLRGADLRGSDLSNSSARDANLVGADMRSSILCGINLYQANMQRADLRQSDMRLAEMQNTNLFRANIVGADLRGAVITGAILGESILDWRWPDIPAELIHRADTDARDCGLVFRILAGDGRPFAWMRELIRYGRQDRILRILSGWIRPGDNAPAILVRLCASASVASNAR